MTLDKVNDRLFIDHHGNSRYDIYQLDEQGMPLRRHADRGVGRNLIGRGFAFAPLGRKKLNFPTNAGFDSVHQRLFVPDDSSLSHPGVRIMVFDVSPVYLASLGRMELPEAVAVLGQPHFHTWVPGSGPAKFGGHGVTLIDAGRGTAIVDEERQLLFFDDMANHRVMVWDINPARLRSGMDAMAVIGQPDFNSRGPGTGRSSMTRPNGLTYDPVRRHLYVMDTGNRRVLVFDVSDRQLDRRNGGFEAFAVIGQEDFESNAPPVSRRKLHTGVLGMDYQYHRLFVGEQFGNRLMVFDVSPEKLQGAYNPDAIAVLGQPDFEETDPAVTQTRLTMPRVTIDAERQLAYVPDGYPAGNRINIFDIHPDRMKPVLTPVLDQLGHINPEEEPDFLSRSANDRTSPRYWTQGRDVSVDAVDHRLFMSDNYGHRVMIFQLDRLNRLLDREAKWVLGQPDPWTSHLLPGRDATTIKLPMAVEYDESHKRLFVADTWNDRVLVYDMTPGKVASGMAASYVLGQQDFISYEPAPAQDRIYFGSRDGRGIYTRESRSAELAMDKVNQRLFVTDGGNHRVLVFDVHPDRIRNGARATHVLGQADFTSTETGLSASRWELPGDLTLDEARQRLFVGVAWQHRVLVFDVNPDRLQDGAAATHVIGQKDFASGQPGLSKRKFRQTDGLSFDAATDRLFVTDKYNHRVLVFDVHPSRLRNQPEAVGVIGEVDFERVRMGPGNPRNQPDRLHDPRGSYFDAADQRLYQSEGLNGRMTVFTMPRQDYRVDLPARSTLRYASLDAHLSTGPQSSWDGYAGARVNGPAKVVALSTHLVTRPVMHPQSERQSRQLISEAMLSAAPAAKTGLLYVDSRPGRDIRVSIVNSRDTPTRVMLTLHTGEGERLTTSRRLASGSQWQARVSTLFPELGNTQGVLSVEADEPVSLSGLLEIADGREQALLLAPVPLVRDGGSTAASLQSRRILPVVTTGAGQQVSYVLLNPTDEELTGQLMMADQETVSYEIEPGAVWVHESTDRQPLRTGYGVVDADTGRAPVAHAVILSARRDGSIRSAHTVTSHQEGTVFWGPVETFPDLLRHGNIDADLTLVNEGPVPATMYLELFDIDGISIAKHERIVPLGERVTLSLEDVFGQSPLRGVLRIFADSEVAVTLQRRTRTIEDEVVVTDVPLHATPAEASDSVIFPLFRNGDGQATEMVLINTGREAQKGALSVYSDEGKAETTILR